MDPQFIVTAIHILDLATLLEAQGRRGVRGGRIRPVGASQAQVVASDEDSAALELGG